MPRGRQAAAVTKLDPLEEVRQLRARQAALRDELLAKRERLLADVVEINAVLAELGGAGENAVAALVPNPAHAALAKRTKATQSETIAATDINPGSAPGRGARLTAELQELAPWAFCLPPTARAAFDLRVTGMPTAAVAQKLGKTEEQTQAAVQYARNRLRQARTKAKPTETPASDDEPGPAVAHRDVSPANDIAPRAPTGWDRADPDQDFTDIEPAPEPAPVLAVVPPPVDEPTPVEEIDDEPGQAAVERVRSRLTVVDGRVRSKTIAPGRLSRAERIAGDDLDYPADIERPRTRGDCEQTARPCPWASCSHHLYLDANPETGAIKLNFPHLEVWELAESCSLDVADRGGVTLEQVGAIINLTRERIRQVEVRALDKIRDRGDFEQAVDHRGSPLAEAISGE